MCIILVANNQALQQQMQQQRLQQLHQQQARQALMAQQAAAYGGMGAMPMGMGPMNQMTAQQAAQIAAMRGRQLVSRTPAKPASIMYTDTLLSRANPPTLMLK
jgi:hypothetical protein